MSRDDDVRAPEQRRAEALVRTAMAEVRVPELSHDFTSRLMARIGEEAKRPEPARQGAERLAPWPSLSRGRRLALHAYWMAACMASSFVLFSVDWPRSIPVTVWIPAVLMGLVCLTPLFLLRQTKVGFTDILLRASS